MFSAARPFAETAPQTKVTASWRGFPSPVSTSCNLRAALHDGSGANSPSSPTQLLPALSCFFRITKHQLPGKTAVPSRPDNRPANSVAGPVGCDRFRKTWAAAPLSRGGPTMRTPSCHPFPSLYEPAAPPASSRHVYKDGEHSLACRPRSRPRICSLPGQSSTTRRHCPHTYARRRRISMA